MLLSQPIVNADDFGMSDSVNRAIVESMRAGFVTTTSILANMPGFEDAVSLAREHAWLNGRIGVHLNLTEGQPLSRPILDCPQFCNSEDRFSHDRRRPLFRLNGRERKAVYGELKTQVERVLAAGIQPIHFDSHHHVHTEWAIAPLVRLLAWEYRIPRIRLTRNIGPSPGIAKRIYKSFFNHWRIGRGHGFHHTDCFGDIGDVLYSSRNKGLKGRCVEIMVHPRYDEQGELVDLDGQPLFHRLESVLPAPPTRRTSS
jgi:predicted glycoside hydrolase/deacetylase ChbG (UPF0249 family)